MVNIDKDKLTFKTKIVIFNKTKNRIDLEFENLITNVGKDLYADRLINDSVSFIDYIAMGNGVVTHTVLSTALNTEIFRKQIENKSTPGAEALFETTILGFEAVGNWTEIGLFNASSGGVLTNVANISYNHIAGDEVSISWSIILN